MPVEKYLVLCEIRGTSHIILLLLRIIQWNRHTHTLFLVCGIVWH